MVARTRLSEHMPHAIEQSLKILGTNLRLARLRRNMSMDDLAARVGVSRLAIGSAENGKPTTSIQIYAGMLWALDLLPQLAAVAAPKEDEEGNALSLSDMRKRARSASMKGVLDEF